MGGEWPERTLGEVIELKRGYDLPQHARRSGSIPIISSSGVTGYHSDAKVKGPGVITGRYGTLGQVFYVAEDFWPLNTALYVSDFKGNDPRFFSYFLRGLDFFAYSDKAAVPGLNRNDVHRAIVRVPVDISEQRAVAHILSTLDDKIELNRRMSETCYSTLSVASPMQASHRSLPDYCPRARFYCRRAHQSGIWRSLRFPLPSIRDSSR